jgi:hypothetical protein
MDGLKPVPFKNETKVSFSETCEARSLQSSLKAASLRSA